MSGYSSLILEMIKKVPIPGYVCTPNKAVSELEALHEVAALGLFPHQLEDTVYQLSTFRVAHLGLVVATTALPEHKVIRPEKMPIERVYGAGLHVDKVGAENVNVSSSFIVVDDDPL